MRCHNISRKAFKYVFLHKFFNKYRYTPEFGEENYTDLLYILDQFGGNFFHIIPNMMIHVFPSIFNSIIFNPEKDYNT